MKELKSTRSGGLRFRARSMIFAAFALGLAVLSLQGALDKHGKEVVDDTTAESIGIFLVARTINAAVSTLQTSTVGAGFTMQIGEALDPVNDAVERLSSAMVWAIGSLLLQGIAVDLAASELFKWGFSVIAVSTALLLVAADQRLFESKTGSWVTRCRDFSVRLFAIAVMIRFAVPMFVVVSIMISEVIVQEQIDQSRNNVDLQREIFVIEPQSEDENAGAANELGTEINANTESVDEQGFFLNIWERIAEISDDVVETVSEVSLPSIPNIDAMRTAAADLVESLTRLLVYVAIKNILLPLVFLFFALKGAIPLTRYLAGIGTPGEKSQD